MAILITTLIVSEWVRLPNVIVSDLRGFRTRLKYLNEPIKAIRALFRSVIVRAMIVISSL